MLKSLKQIMARQSIRAYAEDRPQKTEKIFKNTTLAKKHTLKQTLA
jgi:hypothetical protein